MRSLESLEDNLLTHELGALLHTLGEDVLEKGIEIKLASSISDLHFSDREELMNLCNKLFAYEIPAYRITRLCINLYNLLSDKGFLLIPKKHDKNIQYD